MSSATFALVLALLGLFLAAHASIQFIEIDAETGEERPWLPENEQDMLGHDGEHHYLDQSSLHDDEITFDDEKVDLDEVHAWNISLSEKAAFWSRANCQNIAKGWLKRGYKYNWSPGSGPHGYRADCSGFVSHTWGYKAPGYVVNSLPHKKISSKSLKRCDALIHMGAGAGGHVALFWGWSGSNPIECGHTSSCCGRRATCPGKCGSGSRCNEYCPGCPIQHRAWSGLRGFQPIRRPGW